MKIVGKMKVDYVSNKTGKRVLGSNIFVVDDITSANGVGLLTDKIYVSDSVIKFDDIKLAPVNLLYNRYGQVSEMRF